MSKKSKVLGRLEVLCSQLRLDMDSVENMVSGVLDQYRIVRDNPTSTGSSDFVEGIIPQKHLGTSVIDFFNSVCLDKSNACEYDKAPADDQFYVSLIYQALSAVQGYEKDGGTYYQILEMLYRIDAVPLIDIQRELNWSESAFYPKKMEAHILFGIQLWQLLASAIHKSEGTQPTTRSESVSDSATEPVYVVNEPPKYEKKHTVLRTILIAAAAFVIGIFVDNILHLAIGNNANEYSDAARTQNNGSYVGDGADDNAADDAESTQAGQQPDVDKSSTKMMLNNQPYEPTDSNGSVLRPIRYNDQLYIPIQAFANAFKQVVEYDNTSDTLYIGDKEWTPVTPEMATYTPSASRLTYSEDQEKLTIGSHHYEYGLFVEEIRYGGVKQELAANGKFQKIN
ncbi:MAG: hypothetical protein LBU58_12325, partial [Clostridiales bacterium]|nr:hypothetical protein [Clostridiales bacterium]